MVTKTIKTGCKNVFVYVAQDCWVARTLPDFNTCFNAFHFLPARQYTLVAVTDASLPAFLHKPIAGYLLHRPKLLELVFSDDIDVRVISLRKADLQSWAKDNWDIIQVGSRNAVTRATRVTTR